MSLNPIKKLELSKHLWFVHPEDTIASEAIAKYLANTGDAPMSQEKIFYYGEQVSGFRLPFEAVLWLVENRHKAPYKFTSYHRKDTPKNSSSGVWVVWKEGKQTPPQTLRSLNPLFTSPFPKLQKGNR
jgi:hypothetical protein